MRRFRVRPMLRVRHNLPPVAAPLLLTIVLSISLFRYISTQLSPLIQVVAQSNMKNLIAQAAASAVDDCLAAEQFGYPNFVDTTMDADGRITTLSLRTSDCAHFKSRVISVLIDKFGDISTDDLDIPLGTLSGELMLSALGPSVRVRVQSVGNASAEYVNEFSAVGINQTKHTVYLELSVTVNLLIPGEVLAVNSVERICVAETIIIGEVPDTYLNLQNEGT